MEGEREEERKRIMKEKKKGKKERKERRIKRKGNKQRKNRQTKDRSKRFKVFKAPKPQVFYLPSLSLAERMFWKGLLWKKKATATKAIRASTPGITAKANRK